MVCDMVCDTPIPQAKMGPCQNEVNKSTGYNNTEVNRVEL